MNIVDNTEKFNLSLQDILEKETIGTWFKDKNNTYYVLILIEEEDPNGRKALLLVNKFLVINDTGFLFRKIEVNQIILNP